MIKSIVKLCAVLAFALVLSAPCRSMSDEPQSECVILLHGMWRTGLSMKPVEEQLEDYDYTIVRRSYPSFRYPIEELAVIAVEEGLRECADKGARIINFVTHSLGGILVRQYLAHHKVVGLKRVVMLGPPNQGSQVADYLQSWAVVRLLQPEAVLQLGTGVDSVPQRLGPVNFDLGIIAGTVNRRRYLPISPRGVSDGTVSVAETVVPGMLDYLELPVSHTFIMWNKEVLRQTAFFLQHGQFDRSGLLGEPPQPTPLEAGAATAIEHPDPNGIH